MSLADDRLTDLTLTELKAAINPMSIENLSISQGSQKKFGSSQPKHLLLRHPLK